MEINVYKNNKLYGLTTQEELERVLDVPCGLFSELSKYKYNKYKRNGRDIEAPNDELKIVQCKINLLLQELEMPEYCHFGVKGKNNLKNVIPHLKAKEYLKLDIIHYFPSTKVRYVRAFFRHCLNLSDEVIRILLYLTTWRGYLPTGAPTSPLLAFWSHYQLFNRLYNKMKRSGITMTLLMDDITLSSDKHILGWVVGFCEKVFALHELKVAKIRRFNYKGADITGVHINQNHQMKLPNKIGKRIVDILRQGDIAELDERTLQRLLGLIAYAQLIEPNKFRVSKTKAQKRLRQIYKLKNRKGVIDASR